LRTQQRVGAATGDVLAVTRVTAVSLARKADARSRAAHDRPPRWPSPSLRRGTLNRSSRREPWWRQCMPLFRVSGACGGRGAIRRSSQCFKPGMDNPGQAPVFHLSRKSSELRREQVEAAVEVVSSPNGVLRAGARQE